MKNDSLVKLVSIMRRLRGKNGCPWDRKQTHKSLSPYVIEEAFEVGEAVESGNAEDLKEELGDLLLQVVFHSQIAFEKGRFDIYDVIDGINAKLITRHPHVFGTKKGLRTGRHVRDFWEQEKKKVKKRDSVIDGVPSAMPSLLRARRLISKAQSKGFKWRTNAAIMAKVAEELSEVRGAVNRKKRRHVEEELGDLLFVLTAFSYFHKINPESALQKANAKFIKRFRKIEHRLYKGINEKEMLQLWKGTKEKRHGRHQD